MFRAAAHADVAELADAPALGAGGQPWGFKSLHPHFIDNTKMVSENARKDLQTFGRSCIDRSSFHKQKQGAFLSKVDMYAYYLDADIKDEIQMVWYLDI